MKQQKKSAENLVKKREVYLGYFKLELLLYVLFYNNIIFAAKQNKT